VARVPLPTAAGQFDARAFQGRSGLVYLAMVRGRVDAGHSVLARLHSECVTGEVLGSRRCDCGMQLSHSLRAIAAEGRGVLVYATGHEGRGIGLIDKLRAYMLQDLGADTVSANEGLGLPADGRDYTEAVGVLRALTVRSVRLLTNNPDKVRALREGGIGIEEVLPLPVAPHVRNLRYLRTKQRRMGHLAPVGADATQEFELPVEPVNVTALLGRVETPPRRPYVILKYAQTLDGRIATASGDSKWISGGPERRLSHSLRAACDAVLVGVGTILSDDPQLTVRLVPGASPARVVLDSTLRLPETARVLDGDAWTVVVTTGRSDPARSAALKRRGVAVAVVPPGPGGVDLRAALRALRDMGLGSMLVEGGARVITSMLGQDLVDRLVVSVAPTVIGSGREAVGDLGVDRIGEGLHLRDRTVHSVGQDVLIAGDLRRAPGEWPEAAAR